MGQSAPARRPWAVALNLAAYLVLRRALLAATYLILFIVAADLSVVQTPMFDASPSRLAPLLPGYGPTRVMLEGAFEPSFEPRGRY